MDTTYLVKNLHIPAVPLNSLGCLIVHFSPLVTTGIAISGLVLYLIATRLLFHPLAKVPGPRLAALTKWYEFYYDVVRDGEYVKHIEKLHTIYGMVMLFLVVPLQILTIRIIFHHPNWTQPGACQ
jgi:hypothetical protein